MAFRAPDNDTVLDPSDDALRCAQERLMAAALDALDRLLRPRVERGDDLSATVVLVTDNSHDGGVSASLHGLDPRDGEAMILTLEAACAIGGFFDDRAPAALRAEPPASSVRVLSIVRQRPAIGYFSYGSLPGRVPDAQTLAVLDRSADLSRPSEATFERLAAEDPRRLAAFLSDASLDPTLLTFAAEIAGRVEDASIVVPSLLALLAHPKAYVREGALYGLALHAGVPEARAAIERATRDESPGVRAAAADLLEGVS